MGSDAAPGSGLDDAPAATGRYPFRITGALRPWVERRARVLEWGLYAVAAAMALVFRTVQDDAFISFRYARNLSQGHGLVFNPGIVRCTGATVGPFLGSSGGSVTFLVPPGPDLETACAAGRLPVGVALTPATMGVSGSGVVVTIPMHTMNVGSTALAFEANAAFRPPGATKANDVTFAGGDLFVNR